MAVTITFNAEGPGKGSRRLLLVQSPRVMKLVTGKFAFDTSYPTGGELVTAIFDEFTELLGLVFEPKKGVFFEVDYTDKKVKAIAPTGGAAPTALAAPSVAVPAGATAVTSTAAQPNLTETGGQGVEFAATTDLSTITDVRFIAWGY